MANLLSTLTQVLSIGATGIQQTFFDPKEITGAIAVPKSFKIDSTYLGANGVSLKASMQTSTRAAIGSRIFPIFSFGGLTDNSTETKYQAFGYGSERKASDGKYTWTFDLTSGGISLIRELRLFNSSDYDFFFVTRDNVLIGTKTGTANEMKGISCDVFDVMPWKASDGTNATGLKVKFSLSLNATAELNENIEYVKCDFDIESSVKGLIRVKAKSLHAASVTKLYVGLYVNEGDTDMVELYTTSIAKAGAIILKDSVGAVITPSAVAVSAVYGGLEITGTFTTATNVTFQMQTPAALAALTPAIGAEPVAGYDTEVLTIAIP